MNQTESQFQEWCIYQVKRAGLLAYKTAALGRRGFPDLILVGNGLVLFVELKSPKRTGSTAPLQKRTLKLLQEQGAHVYVVDSREIFTEILHDLCQSRANEIHKPSL